MTDFAPGDIVLFRFPYRHTQVDYARPCLVLETDTDSEEVLLGYGTTSNSGANKGHEVRVLQDYLACGLEKPSRFVAARRIRVRRDDPRFELPARMGALTPTLQARIPHLLALLVEKFPNDVARLRAERRGIHPTKPRHRRKPGARREEATAGPADQKCCARFPADARATSIAGLAPTGAAIGWPTC